MTDHSLLECHGGPWDGRRIVERGPQFAVTSTLTHDGTLQRPRRNAGVYERRSDGYHWRPDMEMSLVDDLEYEVLAWLGAGNQVFRPREATAQAEEAFRGVIAVLDRLRDRGLLTYLDGHVGRTESGIYLMVGPVELTPAGVSTLERDRSLGARPSWAHGPLPWRS
jgi:hypothetical protein